METFQNWIRQRLNEWLARDGGDRRGSVQRFALAIGIGPSTLSQWLRGAARPDEFNCLRLSRALALPVEEVRVAAGRQTGIAETPATYKASAGSELLEDLRHALGPDYEFIASLDSKERQRLLLAWAAQMSHHLQLYRRIRELEGNPTA
jgi:transcriptional regulator with XRE-family HTH domain